MPKIIVTGQSPNIIKPKRQAVIITEHSRRLKSIWDNPTRKSERPNQVISIVLTFEELEMATSAARPEKSEYATYYERYISVVPDGDIVAGLGKQLEETLALIRTIPED